MNLLCLVGFMAEMASKVRRKAISAYKTWLIQKNDTSKKIGHISDQVTLKNPKGITLGEHSYINGGFLSAEGGRISIGDNCLLSYGVHIRTDSHLYRSSDIPIRDQGHRYADVTIEDDVWVGYGAQIMPGILLGTGCVIGAGAVVTKDTEPYGIYVGVPARRIGFRGKAKGAVWDEKQS